ncbi:TIGR02611 family protein [Cryobacterium sp. TMT1-3]|uniref:TIGR02611 family protein n=1 Tax=Cryobacterium luteum TaxID=1424661 RepID=A0A1H8IAN1_9MICO|nr:MULTISPECIES: TIGR02611 family protein [Cryobacterium]TFB95565.1 TIGR02611 family protein [Cryobacterium luteum]TFC31284.1 TIGR02611 family protein [Cryobacterium sp. TMT1-3]SEN65247.1 TIGR02611 family protein [Cryobacterium luteum]
MSEHLSRDMASGSDPRHPVRRVLRRTRAWVDGHPYLLFAYRLGVGLLGTIIIVIGVVLIPLPGPGWLIVFLGLAVLGTEFAAARRVGEFFKRIVTRAWAWWRARRERRVSSSA